MTRISCRFAAAFALSTLAATTAYAQNNDNVMIVFDGSNSMWGQIDGTAKIEIARGVMDNLLGDWTDDRSVGLMAYGHRERGNCADIETLVTPADGTKEEILKRINAITPKGKTPLTDAVEQAATTLSFTDTPATVILISDGLESCQRNPCALAETLERTGVDFTAHVVGFGLGGDKDTASLSCIAEKTGGRFISATNADELKDALTAVGSAVAKAPEADADSTPELRAITVSGPESAVIGSKITVGWSEVIKENDYITIVPAGSDEGTYGNYVQVRDKDETELKAPAETGMYELRYILREGNKTLARQPIEVVAAAVTIDGPKNVETGERFTLNWTGAVANDDYVAIVPAGADEGTYGNYIQVRDKSEGELKAPAETGLYELRYILREGGRTLATTPIEVIAADVTVSGPAAAMAGQPVTVSWTGTVAQDDYIAIVPMGSEDGEYGNNRLVRDLNAAELVVPGTPGMYELRYILREGGVTMARAPLEATAPEVKLQAPEQVRKGDKLVVGWTQVVNKQDYINLVPLGAPDDTYGSYGLVRDVLETDLKTPDETGLYELRYLLRDNGAVIARRTIEVLSQDAALNTGATLKAPESAAVGAAIEVSWSGGRDSADQRITVADADQAIFTWISAVKLEDDGPVKISMPDEPGSYELRFLDVSNQEVLARQTIRVE